MGTKTTKEVWRNRAERWRLIAGMALDRLEEVSPGAREAFVEAHYDDKDAPTLDEAEDVIRGLLHNMGGSWTEQCVRSEAEAKQAAGLFLMKLDRRAS